MRRFKLSAIMIMVLVVLVACATLQQQWDKATPQEKSRLAISQFQLSLKSALDGGGVFVDANPKYRQVWKDKGLATAKVVNGLLDQFIKDLDAGKEVTFTTITIAVAGKMGEIIALVGSWGVKVSNIPFEGGEV